VRGFAALVAGFVIMVVLLVAGAAFLAVYLHSQGSVESAQRFSAEVQHLQKSAHITILHYEWNAEVNYLYLEAVNDGTVPIRLHDIVLYVNHVYLGRCGEINCVDATENNVLSPGEHLYVATPLDHDAASVTVSAGYTSTLQRNWVPGCPHRRVILVYNGTNSSFSDYQVPIDINDPDILASDANRIALALSDGTTLAPFWVEYWGSSGGRIWVKTPIPANGRVNIYLYYDCNTARTYSPADVFLADINGLIASYFMDENAGTVVHDSSGNAYDGNFVGAAIGWATGYWGSAVEMNNNSNTNESYVNIAPSAQFNTGNTMTILSWVYWVPKNTSSTSYLVTDSTVFAKYQDFEFILDSGGYGWFAFYDADTGDWESNSSYPLYAPSDSWHFVALSFDRPEISFFFDGNVTVKKLDGSIGASDGNEYIGIGISGQEPFNGRVDELAVFSVPISTDLLDLIYRNRGYATPYYPGHFLVRRYTQPPPTVYVSTVAESYVRGS